MLAGALLVAYVAFVIVNGTLAAVSPGDAKPSGEAADAGNERNSRALFIAGRNIFRHDTFGDQAFWGDALQLHRAIAGAKNGGVGPRLSPKTALAVGLKVDSAAIPKKTAAAIKAGQVDLNDPAVTLALLKLNAVVGVKGFFDARRPADVGRVSPVRPATPWSTTPSLPASVAASTARRGIATSTSARSSGWRRTRSPSRTSSASTRRRSTRCSASWGPGRFDAVLFFDGKAFRPDGRTAATLIPPAFGLAGVDLATYTGWGSVTYWNALVANLEMHGRGNFDDDRLSGGQLRERPARLADDQPRGQHHPLGRACRVLFEQRHQNADRFHAHLPDRLLDGRERRRGKCRLRDVVEADDRQIARYREPAGGRRGHDCECHPVVGREDRRRARLECQQPVRCFARVSG